MMTPENLQKLREMHPQATATGEIVLRLLSERDALAGRVERLEHVLRRLIFGLRAAKVIEVGTDGRLSAAERALASANEGALEEKADRDALAGRVERLEGVLRTALDALEQGERELVAAWGKRDPPYARAWGAAVFVREELRAALADSTSPAAPPKDDELTRLRREVLTCEECGEPATALHSTEADGNYWLCDSKDAAHSADYYCSEGELFRFDSPAPSSPSGLKKGACSSCEGSGVVTGRVECVDCYGSGRAPSGGVEPA